ncbi:MAG: hypothetical protein ABR577_19070 [Pyrinomonadaceae bacterium]
MDQNIKVEMDASRVCEEIVRRRKELLIMQFEQREMLEALFN